jgi:hypothetical protein
MAAYDMKVINASLSMQKLHNIDAGFIIHCIFSMLVLVLNLLKQRCVYNEPYKEDILC